MQDGSDVLGLGITTQETEEERQLRTRNFVTSASSALLCRSCAAVALLSALSASSQYSTLTVDKRSIPSFVHLAFMQHFSTWMLLLCRIVSGLHLANKVLVNVCSQLPLERVAHRLLRLPDHRLHFHPSPVLSRQGAPSLRCGRVIVHRPCHLNTVCCCSQ